MFVWLPGAIRLCTALSGISAGQIVEIDSLPIRERTTSRAEPGGALVGTGETLSGPGEAIASGLPLGRLRLEGEDVDREADSSRAN